MVGKGYSSGFRVPQGSLGDVENCLGQECKTEDARKLFLRQWRELLVIQDEGYLKIFSQLLQIFRPNRICNWRKRVKWPIVSHCNSYGHHCKPSSGYSALGAATKAGSERSFPHSSMPNKRRPFSQSTKSLKYLLRLQDPLNRSPKAVHNFGKGPSNKTPSYCRCTWQYTTQSQILCASKIQRL